MVADLVRRITQHQVDFFYTLGNPPQADGKPVPAQNREGHANGIRPEFLLYVLCNRVNRRIIALCAGNHRFGHRDDVFILKCNIFFFSAIDNTFYHDFRKVVPLADHRRTHASYHCSDCSQFKHSFIIFISEEIFQNFCFFLESILYLYYNIFSGISKIIIYYIIYN